ncbi:YfbR-like 5'-deoxynucleotidase [Photobacterium leiognathi]|uniref:YfbR-like 5'-deoxynucleotidase n=1 Tax=Photobacterium leiognathi TaxID=553611 RepID=UPI00298261DA|nr:YfbR-like 5'-deoxynucleotidase [Photobacterium leiognathi]
MKEKSSFLGWFTRQSRVRTFSKNRMIKSQSVSDHSFQTAMIGYLLGVLHNDSVLSHNQKVSAEEIASFAVFGYVHKPLLGEITKPVKNSSDTFRAAVEATESFIAGKVLETLPEHLRTDFTHYLSPSPAARETQEYRYFKMASKISYFITAKNESLCGNKSMDQKAVRLHKEIHSFGSNNPSVKKFIVEYLPAAFLDLDDELIAQSCGSQFMSYVVEASNVRRWGTAAAIDIETVSAHSMQVAVFSYLYTVLHNTDVDDAWACPDPTKILMCALFHDLIESGINDLSGVSKHELSPLLRLEYKRLEDEVTAKLLMSLDGLQGDFESLLNLSEDNKRIVKNADILQACLWAEFEYVVLKNDDFKGIYRRLSSLVDDKCRTDPVLKQLVRVFADDANAIVDKLFSDCGVPMA